MLVVMALMALATSLVVPRLSGWMTSVQERGWRADLKAYLEGMPVRAFLAGEEIRLDVPALQAAVAGAPAGVEVRMTDPLVYGATGAALGGRLEFIRGASREVWTIQPISGHVTEGS